jgi:hypothetical protein
MNSDDNAQNVSSLCRNFCCCQPEDAGRSSFAAFAKGGDQSSQHNHLLFRRANIVAAQISSALV